MNWKDFFTLIAVAYGIWYLGNIVYDLLRGNPSAAAGDSGEEHFLPGGEVADESVKVTGEAEEREGPEDNGNSGSGRGMDGPGKGAAEEAGAAIEDEPKEKGTGKGFLHCKALGGGVSLSEIKQLAESEMILKTRNVILY